ncbi:MAG: hypothetical protein KKF30_16070 [Proteobacteria bacterium]|nr:hypothetical protein [Pseudomonadota bacterium]MBU4472059.1 hypothetical protein [Pseudomonadota bacterium]
MTLYDDLRTSELSISKEKDGTIQAVFCFDQSLKVFEGHFPGKPILPGIFQFEMVRYAVEKISGSSLQIQSIQKSKFPARIYPGEKIYISIKLSEGNQSYKIRATIKTGELISGKLNMTLFECVKE